MWKKIKNLNMLKIMRLVHPKRQGFWKVDNP